jgi:dTDP-3-amino-2,3,6-trideoxy-4-keto-D-glucose/dTDP-3-amino-3,4,6-trideoxy-alpha-D-glucose/dTDP-2,6-dideoxy-D-kanosamine transaminase
MQVPFNDLKRGIHEQNADLMRTTQTVLDSGWVVLGPRVQQFEQDFAALCGPGLISVSVANGSDALALALAAAGVSAGDRVLCCANAAMYSTLAVLSLGAEPVFVDVGDDHTMSVSHLREVVATSHAKVAIVTHLYGQLAQVETIKALLTEHGIVLIEDCAQAHLAERAGKRAGSFGRFACFSFYPTKNLGALGDGGAVLCQKDDDATLLRRLRQYGWHQKYSVETAGGRNSRLDELQAAYLSVRMQNLPEKTLRRRQIAQRYSAEIKHPAIRVPHIGDDHVAHLYVLECNQRAELKTYLEKHGIDSDIHYPIPDHRQAVLSGQYANTQLPQTERAARSVLSLPCFPELTDDELTYVINCVNAWSP